MGDRHIKDAVPMAENIHEICLVYSADHRELLSVSPTYEAIWGRSCASLYENPMSWLEAVHPEDRERVEGAIARQLQGDLFRQEYRIIRPDGEICWIYARTINMVAPENGAGTTITLAEDITERKQTAHRLQRLNRALLTMSACHQALVRATDEAILLQDICHILVDLSGYRAVWIGFAEQDEARRVRPVAQAGYAQEYLQFVQVHWSDDPLGQSAMGTAIRRRQVCIAEDLLNDPHYLPWHEAARRSGYAAAIALPLMVRDQVIGALGIYSSQRSAFDQEEVELLTGLANDLAYGITTLRTRTALQQNEHKFRSFLEMASEAVIVSNHRGEIVIFNAKAEEIFGYTTDEVLGHTIEFLMPERFRQGHRQFRADYYTQPMQRSMGHARNLSARRKDGTEFSIEAGLSAVQIGDEQFVLTFLTDISDRKQAEATLLQTEAALREANQALEQRVQERTVELSQSNTRLHQELQERQRTQQVLEEQAHLLDLAHDTIMTRDLNGMITFWNRGAEQMYGWMREEVLGRSTHTLLQTEFSCPQAEIEAVLLQQGYWEGVLTHRRRDGTPVVVASRWVLQRDDQGQPMKVLEINNDITQRKRAEENQARLVSIIESSDDGILSTTLDGRIDSWNRGAEALYGYSTEEILGQSIGLLLPPDRLHEEAEILERLRQGDRFEHYETVRQHKSGQLIDISLTISPIRNASGELIGMSKIARDISRRKQAEEQLRLSRDRISLANAELARAARLKDEFLAGMSHELRTPLNAVLGLSEALLEEVFGHLTPEQREHITTIEKSGKHLLELINDILDLSKVESGKMDLEVAAVNLQTLCSSSLNLVKQQAHHKRIKLHCQIEDELTEIRVDERRMRQVLVNLLSNAVKFTPDGGQVQLRIRADHFRETVELSITDTGIGIAPENISRLFQPFVQLDSALSRRYAGTGLGLALVRRITELHGGSVALESQEGKGSRFTITLPWYPLKPELEWLSEGIQAEGHPLQIQHALIVEDSEAAANQVARYLTELGANTVVHPVGSGAVQVATQLKPDVIILDILLPDRSGWDVLADLKANPATQMIPVVVTSVVDERSCALALGASAYLLKPISRQHFQQILSQVIVQEQPPEEATALVLESAPVAATPLILLAEDNETNIATFNSYLQARGFRVIIARNGTEAVQMAQQYRPDLILMDIQMPEMDGLEAMGQIRTEARLQATPMIALTALAMPGDRERCIAAGAVDYLTKPVSLKHLLSLITQHLQKPI